MLKERYAGHGKKEDFPSQEPGPCAGTVCHTSRGEIIGTVSQEKWEKARALVMELAAMAADFSDTQEQECKVIGKTRKQIEDAIRFSEGAKVS